MSYSVAGSINLAYPGVNAQDYHSWQFKDTMTFTTGNHTLKWGYEFIRPVFEFNLALDRTAAFQGTRTGDAIADFMIGAFENSTIEFGIADHSPSTMKHQAFIEDSYKVHPRLTLNYGLRYEPFIPFDQKGGRHNTWVPGVQSTVVPDAPKGILFPGDPGLPSRLTNSDLNNLAPRLGVAWDVTGEAKNHRSGRVRHLLPADERRNHARGRGTMARNHPASSGPHRRSVRFARANRASARISWQVRVFCHFGLPGAPLHAIPSSYPDRLHGCQNLRTTYTHHFSTSLQRQLTTNLAVEGSYIGKLGRRSGRAQLLQCRALHQFASHRTAAVAAECRSSACRSVPGIISAQSRVLGNFFRSEYHSPSAASRAPHG